MTKYLVLRQAPATAGDPPSASWTNVAEVEASGPTSAIKQVAAEASTAKGTYVAVPARSWKPVTVQAVQTTTIKLGEAT
jgi:hypothetical protein